MLFDLQINEHHEPNGSINVDVLLRPMIVRTKLAVQEDGDGRTVHSYIVDDAGTKGRYGIRKTFDIFELSSRFTRFGGIHGLDFSRIVEEIARQTEEMMHGALREAASQSRTITLLAPSGDIEAVRPETERDFIRRMFDIDPTERQLEELALFREQSPLAKMAPGPKTT